MFSKLDPNDLVVPPNKPLERELLPSKTPVRYDHQLFLDINSKDEFILGSANLADSYWESCLCHFETASKVFSNDYRRFYIGQSSISCGRFVDDSTVILAEDSGQLKLFEFNPEGDSTDFLFLDVFGTDNPVEQISTWPTPSKFVTCSDTYIDTWKIDDNGEIRRLNNYLNYHTGLVASVDVDKSENHVFASASHDRRVCLWDDRASDAHVSVLYRNEFAEMTSVSWNPSRSRTLVAGCRNGTVYGLDARQPGTECPTSMVCFEEAPVHALRFSQNGLVAVCGDSEEVVVLNANGDCRVVYRSSKEHTNYVRGLAWTSKGALYSCGFDKTISRHEMPAI